MEKSQREERGAGGGVMIKVIEGERKTWTGQTGSGGGYKRRLDWD